MRDQTILKQEIRRLGENLLTEENVFTSSSPDLLFKIF